jgi:hypothetical protein
VRLARKLACSYLPVQRKSRADNKLRGVMKTKAEGDAVDSQPTTSNALMWNPQELLEQLDDDRAFLCEFLLVYRRGSQTGLPDVRGCASSFGRKPADTE